MLALGTWTRPSVKEGNGWRVKYVVEGESGPELPSQLCFTAMLVLSARRPCVPLFSKNVHSVRSSGAHVQFSLIIRSVNE